MLQTPAFYQIKDYVPTISTLVTRTLNSECVHLSEQSRPDFENKMMHYFSEQTYERAGVLYGEYLLHKGLILIRRDGMHIKANMAWEDCWGGNRICDDLCITDWFLNFKEEMLGGWDMFTTIDSPIIVSHSYAESYYHYTAELITKNRFFTHFPKSEFLVSSNCLDQPFQRDLLSKASDGRNFNIPSFPVLKVRDPIVSHEIMSEAGIDWLRGTMKIPVKTGGGRRIYIRRTHDKSRFRSGGGISESPEFVAFLREFGFQAIDFSDQPMTVEQQVMLLDGASVVLATHGAAMTNLAYLSPPLAVIEVIGSQTPRGMFMHLASMLKFQYYGVYRAIYDLDENMIVDIDELRGIMKDCLS